MGNNTCSVDGCERPVLNSRGWCNRHYLRWTRHGDPIAGRREVADTVEQRFWSKVDRSDLNGCWTWTACRNRHGYGQMTVNGKRWLAHRFGYELCIGHIPDGLVLDHICRNGHLGCVRPDHLRPVLKKKNHENRTGLTARNRSGVHGVYWDTARNCWAAEVRDYGEKHFVGRFNDLATAEAAVVAKRNELFTHNDLDR